MAGARDKPKNRLWIIILLLASPFLYKGGEWALTKQAEEKYMRLWEEEKELEAVLPDVMYEGLKERLKKADYLESIEVETEQSFEGHNVSCLQTEGKEVWDTDVSLTIHVTDEFDSLDEKTVYFYLKHMEGMKDRLIPKVLEEDLPAYGDLEDRMMMFLSRRTKRKLVVKQDWNRAQVRTRRNTYEYEKTTPAVGPSQVYHINGERYGVGIGKLSEYRQERKKTTPAPTPTPTPKAKRSSRSSGKTTVYNEAKDYYEIDEYDDPEDFYEAFEDDFEDVEDAEDYWDEYHDE